MAKLKEGQVLTKVLVRQSDRNENDGLAYHDRLVVIVKDVGLKKGQQKRVDIRVDLVRDNFAIASVISPDDDDDE